MRTRRLKYVLNALCDRRYWTRRAFHGYLFASSKRSDHFHRNRYHRSSGKRGCGPASLPQNGRPKKGHQSLHQFCAAATLLLGLRFSIRCCFWAATSIPIASAKPYRWQLLLLAAGTKGKRFALPHSRIMLHQPYGGVGGTSDDIALQAREIFELKKITASLMSRFTGQSIEKSHTKILSAIFTWIRKPRSEIRDRRSDREAAPESARRDQQPLNSNDSPMSKKTPEIPPAPFAAELKTLVEKLISGPNAYICDKCVGLCVDIIQKKPVAYEMKLLKPKEIKAHLDEYIIGQETAKKNHCGRGL